MSILRDFKQSKWFDRFLSVMAVSVGVVLLVSIIYGFGYAKSEKDNSSGFSSSPGVIPSQMNTSELIEPGDVNGFMSVPDALLPVPSRDVNFPLSFVHESIIIPDESEYDVCDGVLNDVGFVMSDSNLENNAYYQLISPVDRSYVVVMNKHVDGVSGDECGVLTSITKQVYSHDSFMVRRVSHEEAIALTPVDYDYLLPLPGVSE